MSTDTPVPVTSGLSLSPEAKASLSSAALAAGEAVVQEITTALIPEVAAAAWKWYDAQKATGIFGFIEQHVVEPIFDKLFGPNPATASTTATT